MRANGPLHLFSQRLIFSGANKTYSSSTRRRSRSYSSYVSLVRFTHSSYCEGGPLAHSSRWLIRKFSYIARLLHPAKDIAISSKAIDFIFFLPCRSACCGY